MDARSYTAEERRAANQVWAAAGAYGFEPLFLARNTDGTIDFYMNCVVGLVHKYYGDDLLRDLFATWDGDLRESQLDDLTWLYLESAVYLLELPRRPVLSELRRAHADYFFGIQYKLSRQEWMAKNQLVYTMQADRWRTVQGRHPPVMTPYESRLAEALSPAQPPQPGQLKGELLGLFARFALFDGKIRHRAGLHLHLEGLLASLATKTLPTQMIKTDRLTVEHSGSVEAGGSGPTADKRLAHITLRQNAAEDRAYIESCFGRSLYPPERLRISTLTGLHHKVLLHTGHGQAVIVARLHQTHKVIVGLRGLLREEHRPEHTRRGIEHRHGFPRCRVGELQLGRFHRRAGDGLCSGSAAAADVFHKAAAGQCKTHGQQQCRQPDTGFIHKQIPPFIF